MGRILARKIHTYWQHYFGNWGAAHDHFDQQMSIKKGGAGP